eukprot:1145076-Pelagomonas_calceolata.AAC.6
MSEAKSSKTKTILGNLLNVAEQGSWEDLDAGVPSPPPPPPPPRPSGLNLNASSFPFNPGAPSFSFAP